MSQSPPEVKQKASSDPLSASRVQRVDLRRRMIECILLAIVALVGVLSLRLTFEPARWCLSEAGCMVAAAILVMVARQHRVRTFSFIALLVTPIAFGVIARKLGAPIPFEMTIITSFGAASLAFATYGKTNRNLALSVVTSGFLVLFTTLISDVEGLPITAFVWIALCLWHLVANHWERVSACGPAEVRRSSSVRPMTVVFGFALFLVGGWVVIGRTPAAQRLLWGLMPNSGGTQWSDPAARSGVGSGDAAIAAKNHPESFGAVESEMFLESTESTLYDMFSDSIGQPKLKQKWERRQGITPEKLVHAHQRTAKSERGGKSFSTSRTMPQVKTDLRDASERAIVQWIGPTGIRLAMSRFDRFDGFRWTQQARWGNDKLSGVKVSDELWFFDPRQKQQIVANDVRFHHAGILKVLKLDTPRIPSPMMTAAVYVKDVVRSDFFGVERDGSLFMPGRDKIPQLTVMHLAASTVLEDQLVQPNSFADFDSYQQMLDAEVPPNDADDAETYELFPDDELDAVDGGPSEGMRMASELAKRLTEGQTDSYGKLNAIVSHLRNEFRFDRSLTTETDDPLLEFLQRKSGGDHLFATAAAMMGREVGLNTRLATGFYVRPAAIDIGQGHASIVPEDIHVWAEVQLNDGRWIEIEPTPGYREPVYTPSFLLVFKRVAQRYWPHAIAGILLLIVIFLTRVVWFEVAMRLAWTLGRFLPNRQRIRILLWILQGRARLAGSPRSEGQPQRDWLLRLTRQDELLNHDATECCDAADRMVFGGQKTDDWLQPANALVTKLTTRYISKLTLSESSPLGTHA